MHRKTVGMLVAVAAGIYGSAGLGADYFDPHNHITGILPYQAYANPRGYLEKGLDGVSDTDLRALYDALRAGDYGAIVPYGRSTNPADVRYGVGTRASLRLLGKSGANTDMKTVRGVLERVLTATPYTEFDSAYAMRGDPVDRYLEKRFGLDQTDAASLLCAATKQELARTHLVDSEQSMNFIGGWKFKGDQSARLNSIECYTAKSDQSAAPLPASASPTVHILLMTHTSELGTLADGAYSAMGAEGRCEGTRPILATSTDDIYAALMAKRDKDEDLFGIDPEHRQRDAYFKTVVGIDTAGVESTCFTAVGMQHYQALVKTVYAAARARRALGWTGRLLVHTHVGEGFTVYYGKAGAWPQPFDFAHVFSRLPAVVAPHPLSDVERENSVGDAAVARNNIAMLLQAVTQVKEQIPDLSKYVVLRFGHVTQADTALAESMAKSGVEADVNLDSNLSTGAYSLSRASDRRQVVFELRTHLPYAKNFDLNDLPRVLIPDGQVDQPQVVGPILGNVSLKPLLAAGVCVMLGTDGAGTEHAPMPRQYALARSLIGYWKTGDTPLPGSINADTVFFDHAKQHQASMADSDTKLCGQ